MKYMIIPQYYSQVYNGPSVSGFLQRLTSVGLDLNSTSLNVANSMNVPKSLNVPNSMNVPNSLHFTNSQITLLFNMPSDTFIEVKS